MRYRHSSKLRRRQPLIGRYRAYHVTQGVRRYLRARPLGLGLLALVVAMAISVTGLTGTQATPTATEAGQTMNLFDSIPNLPHWTALTTSPLPFLSLRDGKVSLTFAGKSPSNPQPTFSHLGITTTVFWVGEKSGAENAYIPNNMSTWDTNWQKHYGGVDNPDKRDGYRPSAFTPRENPFYFALPYSDLTGNGARKSSAKRCPLAASQAASPYSWCKNSWIAIRHGGKVVYAQWQDAGPLGEDDTAYVFGSAAPKNSFNAHAGLDVSPAVRDYLGLNDIDRTDWSFIPAAQVPDGPWRHIVTTSTGDARVER